MDVLAELKLLRIETGSIACLGCRHEHNCSVHGCAIINEAYFEIQRLRRFISYDDAIMRGLLNAGTRPSCGDCGHKVKGENGEYNPGDIVCDYWESDGLTAADFCSYFQPEADT